MSYIEFFIHGLLLGPSVFVLGKIMDNIFCKREVKILKEDNEDLYNEAMEKTWMNLTIMSSFLYWFITPFFVNYDENNRKMEYLKLLGLIFIQNIGYYYGHYLMHHNFYSIHSFHHRFDKHVSSSIAFAVTVEEFLFAYITPLMIGAYVLFPNETTFVTGIGLIAIFNLIIHTPCFKTKYYPSFFVSPKDHLEHHEKKTIHYAAPIFSIDRILLFLKN